MPSIGHPTLEHVAKQADYVIGAALFLAATVLFLWVVTRKEDHKMETVNASIPQIPAGVGIERSTQWKVAAFAILALLFVVPGAQAIQNYRQSLAASRRILELTPQQLDALMPKQLGNYKLVRAWQQKTDGKIALESAAYATPGANEIVLGIWLRPTQHSVHDSRAIRGEDPEMRASQSLVTEGGQAVSFDTAFYSDGITDSLAGNAFCTPYSCAPRNNEDGMHMDFTASTNYMKPGMRAVPIFPG